VSVDGVDTLDPADPLAAFHSETDWSHDVPATAPRTPHPVAASKGVVAVSLPPRPGRDRSPGRWAVFLLAAVAIAEAPFVAMWVQHRAPAPGLNGTVYVETEPSGAEVRVNGTVVGRTPARLSIPRGEAAIELRHAGSVRVVPLTIAPEETVRLRVDLPAKVQESAALPGSTTDISADAADATVALAAVAEPPAQ